MPRKIISRESRGGRVFIHLKDNSNYKGASQDTVPANKATDPVEIIKAAETPSAQPKPLAKRKRHKKVKSKILATDR